MGSPLELDDIWLARIKQSVEGLEYGQVQIIIHDGKIVQIERTERRRFGSAASQPGAAAAQDSAKKHHAKTSD